MRVIHILIVEDEVFIRAGVRRMLENFFRSHIGLQCMIYESSNGRDAYRKCVSGTVDILITDIKMPAMSGVSLVRRLVKEQLQLHMLAISGYQDYEYVREMMKLGVYDYLIKPIDEVQLHEAMAHFVGHLREQPRLGGATLQLEQRMIEYLMHVGQGGRHEYERFMRTHGLGHDSSCEVLLVRNDTIAKNKLFELYYLIGEYVALAQGAAIQGELSAWVVILIHKEPMIGYADGLIAHIEQAGHTIIRRFEPMPLSSLGGLQARLASAFYDIQCEHDEADAKAELERIGAILLGDGETAALRVSTARLFACYQRDQTPLAEIKRDLSALIYQAMSRNADFIEFVSKSKFTRYDLTENFDGAPPLSALLSRVTETFEHLSTQMQTRRDSQTNTIFAQVNEFMQDNFASDLQLNQVAELAHLHPNYFSTLFRQRMGLTFREYLRKLRIEAAKQLITSGGQPMNVIAGKVGYGDTSHFFRAFKNVTGMTPSAYKNWVKGNVPR